MKWPHGSFKMKWNSTFNEPEINQAEFADFHITYNPDDNRFYVSRLNHDRAGDTYPYDTLGTYKNTQKGYENAVQRMKREIRISSQ